MDLNLRWLDEVSASLLFPLPSSPVLGEEIAPSCLRPKMPRLRPKGVLEAAVFEPGPWRSTTCPREVPKAQAFEDPVTSGDFKRHRFPSLDPGDPCAALIQHSVLTHVLKVPNLDSSWFRMFFGATCQNNAEGRSHILCNAHPFPPHHSNRGSNKKSFGNYLWSAHQRVSAFAFSNFESR